MEYYVYEIEKGLSNLLNLTYLCLDFEANLIRDSDYVEISQVVDNLTSLNYLYLDFSV